MSFPRFHIATLPTAFPSPVHGLAQHLQAPALLGTLAGFAFAASGLLVNSAYFPAFTAGSSPTKAQIVSSVSTFINDWQPETDPLLTVPGVGQVKASNLQGVDVGGQRYYYRMVGAASFDPVSQGQASHYETVAVLDAGTEWEVQIYRLD